MDKICLGKLGFCVYSRIFLVFFLFSTADVFGKSINEYNKEINKKTQNLEQLQKVIKDKRVEKEQRLLEEKTVKRELYRIDQQLNNLQRQIEKVRKQIRKAKNNLKMTEQELQLADWEKNQWLNAINREINLLFRSRYSYYGLINDPLSEYLRIQAINHKEINLTNAEAKENNSQQAMEKWKMAQAELIKLKAEQEKMLIEKKQIKDEKLEILKTTTGQRIAADEELKKLVESAMELEQLITRLGKEKKQTETELIERKKFQERRKQLPWPVDGGEVAEKFGKNKRPEMDAYLISNGIKIRCHNGADVRAVNKGEVIFSGEFRSYGQMIIIDHGGGFYTLYGNLGEILVEEGKMVKEGDAIGTISALEEPILYFEVRSEGKPENPVLWLK